tara:strand:+ start:264 stop:476 length:213 start_codon:yes stop_codon:yes gene_type:complete
MNASQSFFVPMVEDLPETEFIPKKKTPKYLPGEKLLISIHKKKSKKIPQGTTHIDIDRLAASLARLNRII